MRIFAYDVETANTSRASICGVGWVFIHNDKEVCQGQSVIDPECEFNSRNIQIHGITPDRCCGAPLFAEYWNSTLKEYMTNSLIIAYNASFDIGATQKALQKAGILIPDLHYIDILQVTRKFIACENHKLSTLAHEMGFQYIAHDPLEDVKAMIFLLEQIKREKKYEDFSELLFYSQVQVQCATNNDSDQTTIKTSMSDYAAENRSHFGGNVAATSNELNGAKICLSGDLPGLSRAEIEEAIMLHGGQAMSCVSRKLQYLVVGIYPDYPDGFVSSKEKRVRELNEQGANIQIINYEELLSLMNCQVVDAEP